MCVCVGGGGGEGGGGARVALCILVLMSSMYIEEWFCAISFEGDSFSYTMALGGGICVTLTCF